MCFKCVHNFTEGEIKDHHMSIITTTHYVLVSPNDTSEKQTNDCILLSFMQFTFHKDV